MLFWCVTSLIAGLHTAYMDDDLHQVVDEWLHMESGWTTNDDNKGGGSEAAAAAAQAGDGNLQ